MKDLVERVARAISPCGSDDPSWVRCEEACENCEGSARRAIEAVLSHFSEPGNVSDKMQAAMVHQDTHRDRIAFAMRAALEEFK